MTDEEKLEIGNIEYWFAKYDLQVKEYERAVRLGLTPNIHIGDKMYTTIEELDTEAVHRWSIRRSSWSFMKINSQN